MFDFLPEWDKHLFLLLNGIHNGFFDFIMWWLSNKIIWAPFYLVLLFLLVRKYGWESIALILSLAILIALSDQVSGFIKDLVARPRPSHSPTIQDQVYTLNGYRGGNYGFVSSHAANSFALAFFLSYFLRSTYKFLPFVLFGWAFAVAYSRIYLGVHYPGDVIVGAVLGVSLAWIVVWAYKIFRKYSCFSKQC